jgi:DNA repair protein RadC
MSVTMLTAREQSVIYRASQIIQKKAHLSTEFFSDPAMVINFFQFRCGAQPLEEFHVAYLNTQNMLLEAERLTTGSIASCAVYVRPIALKAMKLGAAAVVLAHNHPSGNTKASKADLQLTRVITSALSLFDVSVLDHVICSPKGGVSLRLKGLL